MKHIVVTLRIIGDKSLSDCVEALIGAFLVNTGEKNTLTVLLIDNQ